MGIFKCCVVGCKSQKKDTLLFNIPTQDNLRDVWLKLLLPVAPSLANMTKEQLRQRKIKTCDSRSSDMGIITCCVDGCKSQKKDTLLFNIPTQDNLRDVWLKLLIPVAPALANMTKAQLVARKKKTYESRSSEMGFNTCCVEGCNSRMKEKCSSRTSKMNDTQLFHIPAQDNLRGVWLQLLIPVAPALANMTKAQLVQRKVCQRHFEEKYLHSGNRRKNLAFPTLFTPDEILTRKPATPINILWKEEGAGDHTYASIPSNTTILNLPEDDAISLGSKLKYFNLDHNYSECTYKARKLLLVSADGEPYEVPNYEVPNNNVAADTQNDESKTAELKMETKKKEEAYKLKHRIIDEVKDSDEEYQRLLKENERIRVQALHQTMLSKQKESEKNIQYRLIIEKMQQESEEDRQKRLIIEEMEQELQRNMARLQKDEEPRERARQLLREQLGLRREKKTKGNINKDTSDNNAKYDDIDTSRVDTHAAIVKEGSDNIRKGIRTYNLTPSVPLDVSELKYELQNLVHSSGDSRYRIVEEGEGMKVTYYLNDEKDVTQDALKEQLNEEIDDSAGDMSDNDNEFEDVNNVEYDGIVNKTEFSYGEDLLGDYDLEEGIEGHDEEQSIKDGPFSWQKFTEEVVPLDGKLYSEDDDVMFCGESQLVPDLCDPSDSHIQEEFSCNVCNEAITGCRYCCVVCADWDLCGACEARGEHSQHYVLRIPHGKTYSETQSVLAALRRLLEDLVLHEDPNVTVIKDEVKTEDPLGEIDRESQEGGAVEGDPVHDTGQLSGDIHEEIQNEDLYTDNDTIVTAIDDTDSIIEVPTDIVPTTHKRKILHTVDSNVPKKKQKHVEPSFVFHYDQNTNEMILVDLSQKNTEESTDKDIEVPQIDGDNFIELPTDENGFIAPQTENDVIAQAETDKFIELPLETGEVIHLQEEIEFIAPQIENNVITQAGTDKFIELSLETGELIRLQVDKDFIAPQLETGEVIRLQIDKDFIAPQSENNTITQAGTDKFIELPLETGEVIRLQVDKDFIAPQLETGEVIRLQVDEDFIAAQSVNSDVIVLDDSVLKNIVWPSDSVVIEYPNESSYKEVLEMSSNDVQYMTLDGQLLDVIDCSKELRVNVTRLSEDEIWAATRGRRVKR